MVCGFAVIYGHLYVDTCQKLLLNSCLFSSATPDVFTFPNFGVFSINGRNVLLIMYSLVVTNCYYYWHLALSECLLRISNLYRGPVSKTRFNLILG